MTQEESRVVIDSKTKHQTCNHSGAIKINCIWAKLLKSLISSGEDLWKCSILQGTMQICLAMACFLSFPQGSQRIYREAGFFCSHAAFTSCTNSSLNDYIPQKQLQKMLGFLFSLPLVVLQRQILSERYPEHAHCAREKSLPVYPLHWGYLETAVMQNNI